MAINTRGFDLSVMPQVNFLDPRLLTPDYSRLLAGVNEGMDTVGKFQSMRDLALKRQDYMTLRANALAAQDAANRANTSQSESQIGLQSRRDAAAGAGYDLTAATDKGALGNVPARTKLDALSTEDKIGDLNLKTQLAPLTDATKKVEAQTALGAATFGLGQQPKTQAVQAAATDLQKGAQDIQKIQQEGEKQAAQIATDFLKKNPEAKESELQAELLTHKDLISRLNSVVDLNKDLAAKGQEGTYTSAARAAYVKTISDIAHNAFTASHGGMTAAEVAAQGQADAAAMRASRPNPVAAASELKAIGGLPAGASGKKTDTVASYVATGELPRHGWQLVNPFLSRDKATPDTENLANIYRSVARDATNPRQGLTLGDLRLARAQAESQTPQLPAAIVGPALRPTPTPAPAPAGAPSASAAPVGVTPEKFQIAVQRLRANPALRDQFENTFGISADAYLTQ